ncbi:hypothetical protein DPMN_135544 [Dreissena polymorpha]|uniref:Uncharacterized protein n=1 Tax=Dreissena polymorpha TaxID=45954 RepID=A0A9D4G166_DREPO|nr:hypothetical protein DPMN_135544 [Dreissena polymorpha]
MSQLQTNLNRMSMQMVALGELAEQRRQVKMNTEIALAQEGVSFEDSWRVFITSDGGMGYLYNAPLLRRFVSSIPGTHTTTASFCGS